MTKISLFLVAMAAAGSMAGAAFADSPTSVTLQTPTTSESEVTAGGVIWSCKADTCVATSDTSTLDSLDACKGIARGYGVVAKFDGLDAAALAKCNRVARH